MRIDRLEVRRERLPLTRAYTIARRTIAEVELLFVRVHAGGEIGLGNASPGIGVTGETAASCAEALERAAELLTGRDPGEVGTLARLLERELPAAPAARAACDMALWDLLGRRLGVSVVELLGRAHHRLPTSVTIGIQGVEEALDEAREHLARGFRALKIKLGHDVEADIERLVRLREVVGAGIAIRTDANTGYDLAALRRYFDGTRALDLELCEQPLPRGREGELSTLDDAERACLAADESLHGPDDVAALLVPPRPFGIFNIKLMKCGGISASRRLAEVAEAVGIGLMWGCMDESRVAIAAALHSALAAPATRFLDLDGSLDLACDAVAGGFVLRDGMLSTAPGPGLGVQWEAE
ncbi:MAG: dipeptide epimerase [Holophagales bacterium]|nr:MAG: dipeptide epimerase [Holophagales bacterium]